MSARARMSADYAVVALAVSGAVILLAVWWLGVAQLPALVILGFTAWSLWSTRYSLEDGPEGPELVVRAGFRRHEIPLAGAHGFERRDRIGWREHMNGFGRRRAYARSFSGAVLFTDADGRRWILTPSEDFADALEREVRG